MKEILSLPVWYSFKNESNNELALAYAKEKGLKMISGSDFHQYEDLAKGGIKAPSMEKESKDFADFLKSKNEISLEGIPNCLRAGLIESRFPIIQLKITVSLFNSGDLILAKEKFHMYYPILKKSIEKDKTLKDDLLLFHIN